MQLGLCFLSTGCNLQNKIGLEAASPHLHLGFGYAQTMVYKQDMFKEELLPATQKKQDEECSYPYQEAIGSIMYAADGTRTDNAFAAGH
jgi:hypothetical protein